MDTNWRERYARNKNLFTKTLKEYNEKPSLKAYLEIFLSLFTISIFGIFAIRPTVITIGKLIREIQAKEKTIVTMKGKIENLKSAQEIYNKEKDKIELAKMAIPDSPSPQDIIRQIEALSALDSITITSLSTNEIELLTTNPKVDQNLQQGIANENQIIMSMSLRGNYENLSNFINHLEDLRRPIMISSVTFNPNKSTEETTIQVSLDGLTLPYIRK